MCKVFTFLEIITVLTLFLGPKWQKLPVDKENFQFHQILLISSNSPPWKTPQGFSFSFRFSFIEAFLMVDLFLTPVWDLRAQWGPQNDISSRRTRESLLSVLVDTLRMSKIQKYQSTCFIPGQKLQGLHYLDYVIYMILDEIFLVNWD